MALKPEILEWLKNPSNLNRAGEVCIEAAYLVSGPRDRQHGAKTQNFQNIADHWNTLLGAHITPVHVGLLMIEMKIARTRTGEHNPDDYVDMAGYAGCAAQIMEEQLSQKDAIEGDKK